MRHISKNRKGTKLNVRIRNGSIALIMQNFFFKLIYGKFDFWNAGL